jgi:glycosyltransferase involved in cell wall biosynthesis
MEAVALIQQQRPNCHVVVVGEDRVAYGKQLPEGQSYKQLMLEKLDLDLSRLHFTGSLPYNEYLQVLQASSAHIYLTRPFVLSWSMLEVMSAGCLLIASNTPPVLEVVKDGKNGLLVDFFSPEQIAEKVNLALDNAEDMKAIRTAARKTIVNNYDLAKLLPQHLDWMLGKKTTLNSHGFGK